MSRFGCRVANAAAWIVARSLFRIDARDLDRIPMEGPFILVSNHVSAFELPPLRMLMNPRPVRTLAKAETWDKKLLGWVLDQWETIPIKRGESDMAALRTALQVLKDGDILGIMPEGTRSGSGQLGRGNPGVSILALKSGCPIVPMAFWGVEKTKTNVKKLRRTDFHLRAGHPFRLDVPANKPTHEDRQKLADTVMEHIAALLPEEYRGVYK
ncbi:1-acyl-sn-glycerol-3-phosphate acyltransferase [Candidatus Bipolaricaulota bacterium]|nr:1-acyl-sn-glycerol-3-phosphate acyltransferase [Candidatus Bipolaricaulota bacterium]